MLWRECGRHTCSSPQCRKEITRSSWLWQTLRGSAPQPRWHWSCSPVSQCRHIWVPQGWPSLVPWCRSPTPPLPTLYHWYGSPSAWYPWVRDLSTSIFCQSRQLSVESNAESDKIQVVSLRVTPAWLCKATEICLNMLLKPKLLLLSLMSYRVCFESCSEYQSALCSVF